MPMTVSVPALGRASLRRLSPRTRAIGFYILTVFVDKGVALLTIPLMAAYLAPSEFGRLDVAISLIEIAGLAFALGLGECLLRFASAAATPEGRHRVAAELLGTGLVAGAVLGIGLQVVAPTLVSALSIGIDMTAMRWALAGASLTALIELPVMWWRLMANAKAVFVYFLVRAVGQICVLWFAFSQGFGAEGALIGNACVGMAGAAVLGTLHFVKHGAAFTSSGARNALLYGFPLVISGFATFAIGSMSRWFLSGRVADADIAHLALSMKLALATALVLQPFTLWWIGRRMAILKEEDGLSRSAAAWGWGVVVLALGAVSVALVAPIFIVAVLPQGYHAAIALLPLAIMVSVLNELCTLSNVGSHLRTTGFAVMAINMAGAVAAVVGYAILVPMMGTGGALAGMMLGHGVRLALFLSDGRGTAPIAYPMGRALILGGVGMAAVWHAPDAGQIVNRLAWTFGALSMLIVAAGMLRLIPLGELGRQARLKFSHARTARA